MTNYLTNAIKNAKEINKNKIIKISNDIYENDNKVCVKVFNTGDNIKQEDLNRIWNRFYKADESRNRDDGGTGIGLAFVKVIMNNYKNKYGVNNKENGVEFYFDLDLKDT
jgi:signal transduction histidine kinase